MLRVALILFVECTLFIHMSAQNHTRDNGVCGPFSKEELLGQITPSSHSAFSLVPQKYTSKSGIYLRTEALQAFKSLHQAAIDEGLEIKILSGTRSFTYQQSIWERKWAKPRYMGWDYFDKVYLHWSFGALRPPCHRVGTNILWGD